MHEMSLCEGVLSVLEQEAAKQGFSTVSAVWLEIGELSAVDPEAMLFSFDAVTRNTLAQGAELHIIDVPGTAWCMPCAESVSVKQRFDACPKCGSHQLQVTGGDEMKIKELEVN